MNKFRLRPAYGSDELLIEFTSGPEKKSFVSEIVSALSSIQVVIKGAEDLWMNDEVLYKASSNVGSFELSINVWDGGFILAKSNQGLIKTIDQLLDANSIFEKEVVDYDDYK